MYSSLTKINDPEVLDVRLSECGELFVHVDSDAKIWFPSQLIEGLSIKDSRTPYLRVSVYDKLVAVSRELPTNVVIVFIEGYRSYDKQRILFLRHQTNYGRNDNVFVSNPDLFSPHLTGGAIDVALATIDGRLLDFGNRFQYDSTAYFLAKHLNSEQMNNRNLLRKVMIRQGFINYPYEWWHWSYGDKYWGFVSQNTAIHDMVRLVDF